MKLVENNNPYQRIVIHHSSFDKMNNDPSYLRYMYWNDHQKLHTDLNSERWNDENFSIRMRKIFSETNKKTWEEKGDIIKKKLKEKWAKRKLTEDKEYFKKTFGRNGEHNGMFNVRRYGFDNPNYSLNKNHIKDINENDFLYEIKNSKSNERIIYRY